MRAVAAAPSAAGEAKRAVLTSEERERDREKDGEEQEEVDTTYYAKAGVRKGKLAKAPKGSIVASRCRSSQGRREKGWLSPTEGWTFQRRMEDCRRADLREHFLRAYIYVRLIRTFIFKPTLVHEFHVQTHPRNEMSYYQVSRTLCA